MNRYSLFVDATYLYAAGGQLCFGTKRRDELRMDFQQEVDDLRRRCAALSGLPALRVYWHDGATDAQPTASHIAVASVQGVQLRLGGLTAAGQKGVDSRIVRDMIVLSHHRAIVDAVLLSGDDDLREGASEAQEMGLKVTCSVWPRFEASGTRRRPWSEQPMPRMFWNKATSAGSSSGDRLGHQRRLVLDSAARGRP